VSGGRTAALGAGILGALGLGWWAQERWPDSRAALNCPPEMIRWAADGASGYARCGQGEPLPPSARLALGMRLPLNRASESDLARIPGVGPAAARALVQARPFRDWDEVDTVKGVGPARLWTLRQATELDP